MTALSTSARAADTSDWITEFGSIAIQDGGRVMPLEGYARRLAVEVTGQQRWSASKGPQAYRDREPVQLLADAMFLQQKLLHKPLVGIKHKPFKKTVGLDPDRDFFTPVEIGSCKGISNLLAEFQAARAADPQASGTPDQRRAMDLFNAVNRLAALAAGERLAIVPAPDGQAFRSVGLSGADPGTEPVQAALQKLAQAYAANADLLAPTRELRQAIAAAGSLDSHAARAVSLELFYDRHNPWRNTEILYGLAVVLFALSRLVLPKPMIALALLATAAGVAEHILGISLRIAILGRAPVSNTFEALLWMGLVGIAVGLGAQLLNRKGYYLFGGVCAALLSVLFAAMVPLTDRTNSLPAVLRSNYWLIVHVLTIVASYGVLAVASVLAHAYLVKEVILGRTTSAHALTANLSHPLIAQTYRTIQIGLLLLTAGTILGGVWAADSWGRFWGWDPKETWALISIVVYFAVLHARYIRWLRDFGLAAAAILGFVVIVWTFYGVNYVMATGLHSYGFGSGGELWVGLWAAAEILFLIIARVRYSSILKSAAPAPTLPAPAAS